MYSLLYWQTFKIFFKFLLSPSILVACTRRDFRIRILISEQTLGLDVLETPHLFQLSTQPGFSLQTGWWRWW